MSHSAHTHPLQLNMTRGVTPISHDIYDLHMTIFWICVAIGILVFGILIYALIKHRRSKHPTPETFHENKAIEILWIIIPLFILILMAIPATLVLMRMDDDAKSELTIKVTGYQWKWKYDYIGKDLSFFSNMSTPRAQIEGKEKKGKWYLLEVDKPLVVPIHTKIRFLVTSNDVIHSWWVPSLGIKRDAIPGYIHESWAKIDKPGTYRGQCAELCGMDHAYMPIVVVAKTQKDFDKWLEKETGKKEALAKTPPKPMTESELMKLGEKVYLNTCAVCHKPDGRGMPPAFPTMIGGKVATGPIKGHIDIVMNGKKGTAMQAFKEQLSDQEIAAVVTYERNAWGNNNKQKYGKEAGGLVQPEEIFKLRK